MEDTAVGDSDFKQNLGRVKPYALAVESRMLT